MNRNKLWRANVRSVLNEHDVRNGVILYDGPSMFDGERIVVVATGLRRPSSNAKTDDMIQTWILRSDVEPNVAIRTGQDASVCGHCMHRPVNAGSCYVRTHEAPLSVHLAWINGGYPTLAAVGGPEIFRGSVVRIGSYGDPAAVPVHVWEPIVRVAARHTGYTHAWKQLDDVSAWSWIMASVDTASERADAKAIGMRTFRVRKESDPLLEGERVCPAAKEAPTHGKVGCETCGRCDGLASGARVPDVTIIVHGSTSKRFANAEARYA